MTTHTILLVQETKSRNTRSFYDYETVALAIEGLIKLYEQKLKELNPHVPKLTYDAKDLHMFIDHYGDICALVFDATLRAYVPHDREWLKQKVLNHLKRAAGIR